MKLVKATYMRQLIGPGGCWLGERPVELSAECEQFGDDVLVVWTDACLVALVATDLNADELVGCQEAMESAFWASEWEECRIASVRQRGIEPSPPATREQIAFVALSALERLSERGAA